MSDRLPRRRSKPSSKSKNGKHTLRLIPQPNGSALLSGGVPGHRGGTGRPPDRIRRQLQELGIENGLPFLKRVLEGVVEVRFVGVCQHCKRVSEIDRADRGRWLEYATEQAKASVDQRLKAVEQTFRYGVGTKESVEINLREDPRVLALLQHIKTVLYTELASDVADRVVAEIAKPILGESAA